MLTSRIIAVEMIKLDTIHNLAFLLFEMHLGKAGEPHFVFDVSSLAQRLKDGVLPKALKEITIAIKVPDDTQWDDALLSLSRYREWVMLDDALWNKSSVLHRVHVLIDIDKPGIPGGAYIQLKCLMSVALPRLSDQPIFSTGIGSFDQLRSYALLRA